MKSALRPRTLVLFVGDIASFVFSLWLSLFLRVFEVPTGRLFFDHLAPFSILFVAWAFVFFIAGLYESRSIILARRMLSTTLLLAQTVNVVIAALFFFLVPLFGIAPKTLLVIYLVVSFFVVLLWRAWVYPALGVQKSEGAIVVGAGKETDELVDALRRAHRAPIHIVKVVSPAQPDLGAVLEEALRAAHARVVIADFADPRASAAFSRLYNFLFAGVRFFDSSALYEEVFGRIPLSVINDQWLARNVSRYAHTFYDSLKRVMDVCVALPAAVVSLVLYPFIAAAVKLQDGGPVVISMPRVGEGGVIFNFYKFRSMTGNDAANYGPSGSSELSVTPVGRVLRVTRLDELPQLWSVLAGHLSLIGPRPEAPALVEVYAKEIPHYGVRCLIKPGLSGWAQLYHDNHPHHGTEVDATREKLSYDLYYLKHRSLFLDIVIALKTVKKLLVQSGA